MEAAFIGMESLERLMLNRNKISAIEWGMFEGLTSLQQLTLSYNHIANISLQRETFTDLHSLRCLYLESNRLTNISPGTFDSLQGLDIINLWGNRLIGLSPDLFINQPRRFVLRMSKPCRSSPRFNKPSQTNQWDCSSLCWLKHEVQWVTIKLRGYAPICSTGRNWASLVCGDHGKLSEYSPT